MIQFLHEIIKIFTIDSKTLTNYAFNLKTLCLFNKNY